jgi:hypothetical protein
MRKITGVKAQGRMEMIGLKQMSLGAPGLSRLNDRVHEH